jgi:hypothetical protein
MARGGGFLRQAWFYELSSEEEEQEKYLHPSSSALSAGGNSPSSSSASSAQCFAVKTNDNAKSAVFFDDDRAQLYVTSLLEPEGYTA